MGTSLVANNTVYSAQGLFAGGVAPAESNTNYLYGAAGLEPDGTAVSITAWYRHNSLTGVIFGKFYSPSTYSGLNIVLHSGSGLARFFVCDGSTTFDRSSNAPLGILHTGVWHHLAVVVSGSTSYLYVDGILVYTQAMAHGVSWETHGYWGIGCVPVSSYTVEPSLRGTVDDCRVYATALSQTDIQAIYRNAMDRS